MWVNSSSSTFPRSPLVCSVNTSIYPAVFDCFRESKYSLYTITFTLVYLLFTFPMYILILWIGFQQWKYASSVTRPTSHADVFTYYMASIETTVVIGLLCYCFAIFLCQPSIMVVGYYSVFIAFTTQTFFHLLTCVERYLAVVHPITYMGLKTIQGIRIRNLSICCVYLLSFLMVGFAAMVFPIFPTIPSFLMLAVIILSVCFLSLSVFCVLRRPGLGNDQAKRRAFHTIMVITGVQLLKFSGQVVATTIVNSVGNSEYGDCNIFFTANCLCLPCSLVMPLLFLQRKGKLACFARNLNQSEN